MQTARLRCLRLEIVILSRFWTWSSSPNPLSITLATSRETRLISLYCANAPLEPRAISKFPAWLSATVQRLVQYLLCEPTSLLQFVTYCK